MYTRCPQCKTVHAITAEKLALARGLVQCGPCGRSFSALSFLFDDWPTGEPPRPVKGPGVTLPILEPATAPEDTPGEPAPETVQAEPAPRMGQPLAWRLATVLLALATILNVAWTFREPLSDNTPVGAWFREPGGEQAAEQGLPREPQKIQLVSRDMHTHPTRSGILVLSLTFVNLASVNQEYPGLEVTLMDASNQPVARRRLQPAEYLRPGADIEAGLAADVYLPVLLELGDPGEQAVGFEIRFL